MIYEFDLSKLKIKHFLGLNRFSKEPENPASIENFIRMGAELCDFDPMELPFSEFQNFITQLSESLVIAFQNREKE